LVLNALTCSITANVGLGPLANLLSQVVCLDEVAGCVVVFVLEQICQQRIESRFSGANRKLQMDPDLFVVLFELLNEGMVFELLIQLFEDELPNTRDERHGEEENDVALGDPRLHAFVFLADGNETEFPFFLLHALGHVKVAQTGTYPRKNLLSRGVECDFAIRMYVTTGTAEIYDGAWTKKLFLSLMLRDSTLCLVLWSVGRSVTL